MSGFKYASQERKVLNLQCAINLNYLLFIYFTVTVCGERTVCLVYVSTPSKNEGKFCNTTNRHALLVWSLLAPYQLVLGGFVLIYGSSVATICLKENTKKKKTTKNTKPYKTKQKQ